MPRSAKINRFLNVRHNVFVRALVGSILAMFVLVLTFQPTLAAEIFRRSYALDQFKTAFRRASFYARRSWLKLYISNDMMFVFCDDLTPRELSAMRRFLLARREHFPTGVVEGELSYVSALALIGSFGSTNYDHELSVFARDVDLVLNAISTSPFPAKTKPQSTGTDTFDIAQAEVALSDFEAHMRESGFPWFVLSGTFLGIVRENDFLKHDYDIDVGIYAHDIDIPSFVETLKTHPKFHCSGLDQQSILDHDDNGKLRLTVKPVFVRVAHEGGIHLDVFIHHIDGDTTWHASSLFRWDNSNFDLENYQLRSVPVKGPTDADRYLTENYGNWRVPVKEFQSAVDTTNQQVVANPLSVAIFLRRIWLSKSNNPKGADALLNVLINRGFLERQSGDGHVFNPANFASTRSANNAQKG